MLIALGVKILIEPLQATWLLILRATGVTWTAVRGATRSNELGRPTSWATTEGHLREAEQVRDGCGEVFPGLTTGLVCPLDEPSGGATPVLMRIKRSSTYPWWAMKDLNLQPMD